MRAEDTLEELDNFVREGKVRAIGTSNEDAYGLMKSLWTSDLRDLTRLDTIQNNFSLNNRRFEDELAECCLREEVSLLPYSPLAGGVLSGKYNNSIPKNSRFEAYLEAGPRQAAMAARFVNEKSLASTKRFLEIATAANLDPITMATAWSKQHDFVASTIIGARTAAQLEPILAASDLVLSPEILSAIDQVSKEICYPMG